MRDHTTSGRHDRAFGSAAIVAVILLCLSASAGGLDPVPQAATDGAVSSTPTPSVLATGRQYVGGDEFNGTGVDQSRWGVYNSVGSGGYGLRRPRQISQSGGALTISCTAAGTTGGMMYSSPQKYGLWEARVRVSPASSNIHPVLLLWPADGDWPVGGEIDYLEVTDPSRQSAEGFLHYGEDDSQTNHSVPVDLTRYNVFSVKWTDTGVYYYLNNLMWFSDTDPAHVPNRPMQPTIQLDYTGGIATPGTMTVDWIRIYN
jgi:beta-glucanase (GH16 family)